MIATIKTALNVQSISELLNEVSTLLETGEGCWKIEYGNRVLFLIVDEEHDRMRMMTPILKEEDLDEDDLWEVMEANFDRSLDARYAIGDGILWSLFLHPLTDLGRNLFLDGLDQVVTLANNFGGSYCSSDIIFGSE
ncbi:MAG: YbjN domain-containing protein [Planctomycetes bacterium]|uniref:hypothetical protein n=1 Tax=uncultured Gimesia sp. TaxID=1678688 RepID=UPI00261AE581|nr:hypothetical protein [uncultured Gimesia sp.]MCH9655574.1 YbjN domain-containing protein [Planctomycetota bacterium]MDF1743362.1 hypothetical protein [Gimesia sp.]MCH9726647.1 YbjN domain-containing protein [Planctomycetota bacterium]MCH9779555.1 YbjN domain-containing protein [Planctomycetota bacterium]MCH9791696.1 YbjN domain-containing protein [Planctomycetota bacterium]